MGNDHVDRLKFGMTAEALRTWVRRAEVDSGARPGLATEERERLRELERENRELRRANEILKAASAFFARELDPRTAEVSRFIGGGSRKLARSPRWEAAATLTTTRWRSR